jgi:hypothetical protein
MWAAGFGSLKKSAPGMLPGALSAATHIGCVCRREFHDIESLLPHHDNAQYQLV